MNEADTNTTRSDLARDIRVRSARIAQVVDSLSSTVLFNALGSLSLAVTFYRGQSVFGPAAPGRLVAAVAVQVLCSLLAFAMRRRLMPRTAIDPDGTERAMIALQVTFASCWGVLFWLMWRDGNAANNLLLTLLIVCVIWSTAFVRSSCPRVFLSGTAVLGMAVAARYVTAQGLLPLTLLVHMPFWMGYIVIMSRGGKRRVDDALIARFANEDMGRELAEARDRALAQRWEAVEANTAKTSFLANMSHELRTPLNAILGFSEIIAEQTLGSDPERYADYARDIHASGEHLLSLINDLLDVAKIEAGKMEIDPQPLDPSHTFEMIERLIAPRAAAKGQLISFPREGTTPWLKADERAFKQIVLNLVSNALKFTPSGGHIALTCKRADDGGFVLCVADDGPGIPPERLSKVFQAFSQVDNRYNRKSGGTGLGLSLVQGLAKLHGGKAWIESEEGRGTRVFVYFPLGMEQPRAMHSILSKF
jgi:two-component system, cell cycle sensor histidine kinase PleC